MNEDLLERLKAFFTGRYAMWRASWIGAGWRWSTWPGT
jgi:hypothetical protein